MASLGKWWARLSAVVLTASLAVFVPVAAWASSGTGELVLEAARRPRRSGIGAGLFGLVCCGVVVVAIVVVLVLLLRRRSGRR
ncbi:hypothetical protein [Micromonospora sp. NBC_01796]|uniref:hypothetical protein n=1 Tax=Micromonospora sp. NBC_01796 TaxID=2975987 RepID=UPI002DDB47EE|nr:hypothetical protein [Micromonospora sp. NBC_01796]WSA89389.1 hypothetical protein OIE47_18270 [Micromonospora sp. NBC_01796]